MSKLLLLIWAISVLSLAWTYQKELRKSNETLIIKTAALMLTILFAPVLSLMQGIEQLKR